MEYCGIHLWAISQEMLKMPILDGFENYKLQLQLYLPGTNDIGMVKMSHLCFLTACGPFY